MKKIIGLLFIAILLVISLQAFAAGDFTMNGQTISLPLNWTFQGVIEVPPNQLAGFSQKLGGEITELKNYIINAGGLELKANVITAANAKEAEKIYTYLRSLTYERDKYLLQDQQVFEFVGNKFARKKLLDLLGLYERKTITYGVKFDLAPVAEIKDYMQMNSFVRKLVYTLANPEDDQYLQQIDAWRGNYLFSDTLYLRDEIAPWGRAEYNFSKEATVIEENDRKIFTFTDLDEHLGMPIVHLQAKIPVKPFATYQPVQKIDREALLVANEFWPVDHPEIQALVRNILNNPTAIIQDGREINLQDERTKVELLLGWMRKNIQYGGETGSRYGVLQVLEQGYGRCLDHSDLLVTLSRAAGLPARMVTGWLDFGHAWVQVYLTGEGWVSIDATGSWIGVSEEYIPFLITETGEIPFIYWSYPEIWLAK